jgi:uncharacterized protein involved in response to NO
MRQLFAGIFPMLKPQIEARRYYAGPVFFQQALRPFFLGAAVYAVVVMLLWLLSLEGLFLMPSRFAISWHAHEMLYGFAGACIAGFLLTAVPNWTGRLPVRGWPLAALFGLWVISCEPVMFGLVFLLAWPFSTQGHHVFLIADILMPFTSIIFLLVLAGIIVNEIVTGRNVRNALVALVISGFALLNTALNAAAFLDLDHDVISAMLRGSVMLVILLVTLIGGRVTPSFTRNFLARRNEGKLPTPANTFDTVSIAATIIAGSVWSISPQAIPVGIVMLLVGGMHFYRLSRWCGNKILGEPLVLVLHLAYLWVGAGFFLAGMAVFTSVPEQTAVHAFTVGAIGTMTLAIMTRAGLGHTGHPLVADAAIVSAYIFITASAIVRVGAEILDADPVWLYVSGLLWVAAYGTFVLRYFPILTKERRRNA